VPAPDSFEEYVAARYASLQRTAYLLCGHHHDAEDIVQSALVKAVGVWRRIENRPDPYVRRVMVNEHISRWRRHRGREVVSDVLPDLPDRHDRDDQDDVLALREALQVLAPRQRAVIVLRFYEDLSEQQVATELGIRPGTVKSQVRDGLARLRETGLADEVAPVHGGQGR
jgi:RNA polymerase sigma-70 factor (sigma-E family)